MKHLFWTFLLVLALVSCRRNHYKVPALKIEIDLSIQQFEKDLFSIDPDSLEIYLDDLYRKYEDFLPLFGYIINIGEPQDAQYVNFLKAFLSDRVNQEVYLNTLEVFRDFREVLFPNIRRNVYFAGTQKDIWHDTFTESLGEVS